MPLEIGLIKPVDIRDVWPTEYADFTPWLQQHIDELDKVLGLGLSDPQREVGAGAFSIDLVAETNFGDVVIENQYGTSDHRHLGQLVTYLSHREVQRAIWVAEAARPEHVKAVETLNERGVGQIWMVTPSEDAMTKGRTDLDLTPAQRQARDFMAALFAQARDEGIDSPFRNLKPDYIGLQDTPARGAGLVYRVAVNRRESRVVLTNTRGRWTGALAALLADRQAIDKAFAAGKLPQPLEWAEEVNAGRWVIRYPVDLNYREPDRTKMRELNLASAQMKLVFDPYVSKLDPQLEEDSTAPSDATEVP